MRKNRLMITLLVDILIRFSRKNVEGMVCSFKNLLFVQSLEKLSANTYVIGK